MVCIQHSISIFWCKPWRRLLPCLALPCLTYHYHYLSISLGDFGECCEARLELELELERYISQRFRSCILVRYITAAPYQQLEHNSQFLIAPLQPPSYRNILCNNSPDHTARPSPTRSAYAVAVALYFRIASYLQTLR